MLASTSAGSRVLGIGDVGRDLRPMHPAALRLARIVEHAGGEFQFGFGERVGRRRRRRNPAPDSRPDQAVGGGGLEARDHALGAGVTAGLRSRAARSRAPINFSTAARSSLRSK